LSKFLFVAAVAAAIIAALCLRQTRRGLLDPRIAASLAIAAAIFTPFVVSSLDHWSRLTTIFRARSGTDQALGFFASRGDGLWSLSTSIGEYALALVAVTGLALLWAKHARQAAPSEAGLRTPQPPRPLVGDEVRFVGYAVLVSVILLLAAVFIGGVNIIKPRFIHIFLYALPILVVAMTARVGMPALRRYAVLLALVGAGILGMRVVNSTPICVNRCEDLAPTDQLATALTAAGFERGTILAHGVRLGGNMVLRFPHARVDVADDPFVPRPAAPAQRGQCLIVWRQDAIAPGTVPKQLVAAADIAPERARAAARTITTDWRWYGMAVVDPIRGWQPRRTTWHYILLPEGTERCR
jgi:hypothetical protein